MSKPWTPRRQTVELRPSKIRRDPPPPQRTKLTVLPDDASERESWIVITGVVLFGFAIAFLTIWISDYTSG